MRHQFSSDLIIDYVLGLLPAKKERQFELHLASCHECQAAVRRERALGQTVRQTLAAATRPSPGQLAHSVPATPSRQRLLHLHILWRPVAVLSVVLMLFLSTLYLKEPGRNRGLELPSATQLAVTATQTPTATLVETSRRAASDDTRAPLAPVASLPAGTPLAALIVPRN